MLIQIRKHLKAQSTAEYAILIGLAIGAVIVMQVYIKRGFQGKMKDATDLVTSATGRVDGRDLGTTEQYEPYYLSREQQQAVTKDTTEKKVLVGGAATTTIDRDTEQKSVVVYGYDPNAEYAGGEGGGGGGNADNSTNDNSSN